MVFWWKLYTFLSVIALASCYQDGDEVSFYFGIVGSYFNPQVTYPFYHFPICRPKEIPYKKLNLAEELDGDRFSVAPFDIHFKVDVEKSTLCLQLLNAEDLFLLNVAVEKHFYYTFLLDRFPLRTFVGEVRKGGFDAETKKLYFWNHLNFNVYYSNNEIVGCNISTGNFIPVHLDSLDAPSTVEILYSIHWFDDSIYPFQTEQQSNLEITLLPLLNSICIVAVIIFIFAILLTRAIKNEVIHYGSQTPELACDPGWTVIRNEVFKFPAYPWLFSSFLSVGIQCLFVTLLSVLFVNNKFNLYCIYLFSFAITGFISTKIYIYMGNERFLPVTIAAFCLSFVPLFLIKTCQQVTAHWDQLTKALPLESMAILLGGCFAIGLPLCILGGHVANKVTIERKLNCNKPRLLDVPTLAWYNSYIFQTFVAGMIFYSATSYNLFYLFSATWGMEDIYLFPLPILALVITTAIVCSLSVMFTYFILRAEYHLWAWKSYLTLGSSSFFILVYAVIFYQHSNMWGSQQAIFYFSDILLYSLIAFASFGSLAFISSYCFIVYLYQNLKTD